MFCAGKRAGPDPEYERSRLRMNCEDCTYYEYDEDEEAYFCTVNMDEDDYGRLVSGGYRQCPFYRHDDEYALVRHQM